MRYIQREVSKVRYTVVAVFNRTSCAYLELLEESAQGLEGGGTESAVLALRLCGPPTRSSQDRDKSVNIINATAQLLNRGIRFSLHRMRQLVPTVYRTWSIPDTAQLTRAPIRVCVTANVSFAAAASLARRQASRPDQNTSSVKTKTGREHSQDASSTAITTRP